MAWRHGENMTLISGKFIVGRWRKIAHLWLDQMRPWACLQVFLSTYICLCLQQLHPLLISPELQLLLFLDHSKNHLALRSLCLLFLLPGMLFSHISFCLLPSYASGLCSYISPPLWGLPWSPCLTQQLLCSIPSSTCYFSQSTNFLLTCHRFTYL